MADIRYKTYQDFSSGLIDKFPAGDSRTPITTLASVANMDVTEVGSLKKRTGFAKLGDELTDTSGSLITGLHYFGYQNQMLAVCTDSLYVYDFDSTSPSWVALGTGLYVNQDTEFANALTYCWIVNEVDIPQRFDGTTMTDSETGTSPDHNRPKEAEFVISKHNRLWYGDIEETDSSEHSSRLRYSGLIICQ